MSLDGYLNFMDEDDATSADDPSDIWVSPLKNIFIITATLEPEPNSTVHPVREDQNGACMSGARFRGLYTM
jgi:hypothetical protein